MLKTIIIGALSIAGSGLCTSDAIAAAIPCDTCMNSTQFRAPAVARGPGTHIVYNITNNTIEQYYVGSNTNGGGGAGGGVSWSSIRGHLDRVFQAAAFS